MMPMMMMPFVETKDLQNEETKSGKIDSAFSLSEVSNLDSDQDQQAEVRLVVKFIVEEQIIFKGRIIETRPLESEEIGRIVSKIALDKSQLASYNIIAKAQKVEEDPASANTTATNSSEDTPLVQNTPDSVVTPESFHGLSSHDCDTVQRVAKDLEPRNSSPDSRQIGKSHQDVVETTMTAQDRVYGNSTKAEDVIDCISSTLNQQRRLSTDDNCDKLSTANTTSDNVDEPKPPHGENIDSCQCSKTGSEGDIRPCQDEEQNGIDASLSGNGTSKLENSHLQVEGSKECDINDMFDESKYESNITIKDSTIEKICAEKEVSAIHELSKVDDANDLSQKEDADVPTTIKDQDCTSYTTKRKSMKRGLKSRPDKMTTPSSKSCNNSPQNSGAKRMRQGAPKNTDMNFERHSKHHLSSMNEISSPRLAAFRSHTDSLLLDNQMSRRLNNTKVFAKWTDLYFYPGTVQKPTRDKKYIVNFCDGGTKALTVVDMIPVVNVNNKNVRVSISKNLCVNALVYGQHSQVQGNLIFDVEYNQDGSLIRRHVPFKDIFLTFDQGSPLVDQPDKTSGASNFADVDLDNIIYEKRSRRFQEMDNYTPDKLSNKRIRRPQSHSPNIRSLSSEPEAQKEEKNQIPVSSYLDHSNHSEISDSKVEVEKGVAHEDVEVNSASPPTTTSNSSNSSSSSSVPHLDLRHEIYFSGSAHRTKTSLHL